MLIPRDLAEQLIGTDGGWKHPEGLVLAIENEAKVMGRVTVPCPNLGLKLIAEARKGSHWVSWFMRPVSAA